jgi:PhzF family phenazine biosynthesis protein
MQLTIYQVDAFAEAVFQGNPAAVVPLETWPSDALMQSIAQENNLAETAFFARENDGYRLRWFTPATEVRLCGHATLASAHVLFEHLGFPENTVHFHTLSGTLSVTRSGGNLTLDFPLDMPVPLATPASFFEAALGLPILDICRGKDDILLRIASLDALEHFQPELGFIRNLEGARGLILTTRGDDTDFASRCFFPAVGVDEDAVTGSAHTLLAPYWAKILGKETLTARQGGSRRGFLKCRPTGNRVEISGKAVTYLTGTLHLSEWP